MYNSTIYIALKIGLNERFDQEPVDILVVPLIRLVV